jgi:hypothetical protein
VTFADIAVVQKLAVSDHGLMLNVLLVAEVRLPSVALRV